MNGTAYATVAIGDIVYVGGTFSQAVSPGGQKVNRQNLAAFCIKDGALLSTFVGDTNNRVWALTTDGTSLFVGGEFTSYNGQASNRLVKVHPTTGARVAAFNPPAIPDDVLALGYRPPTPVSTSAATSTSPVRVAARAPASTRTPAPSPAGASTPTAASRHSSSSGGLAQQNVYIGGSFDVVNNVAHNALGPH